ncbi:hypothetical protein AL01_03735 [Bombella intestini]|uniref:Uncharacterized protein n=1 Tax=Bombella intestini TaxID=1539051 RepID=A0A1S8GQR6_9PROT|nr:hypothetical protein [Bombella intestini]OOL18862.1 hypothetical protein AL01_03735 [Bombella intestini]
MEVFSRRSSVLPPRRSEETCPVMEPEQVQALFRRRLTDICARFAEWQVPIIVSGVIGDVPPDRWRRREGTPLLDGQTGTSLLLDMSPSLLEGEGLHAGEHVRVCGLLRAHLHRGQITPRFEVLSIIRDAEEAAERQREELLQLLREMPPQRRSFPVREGARMLLLGVGVGLERLKAIQQSLGGFWTERNVTVRSIPDHGGCAELSYLHGVEQDVILLVIAGSRLAEMDSSPFVKGLLQCPVYRVLAYDVAADSSDTATTILPHMVDCFFQTTAEAVSFIRQQSGVVRRHQEEERAHQEELAALRASLAALAERPRDGRSSSALLLFSVGLCLGGGLVAMALWGLPHLF